MIVSYASRLIRFIGEFDRTKPASQVSNAKIHRGCRCKSRPYRSMSLNLFLSMSLNPISKLWFGELIPEAHNVQA